MLIVTIIKYFIYQNNYYTALDYNEVVNKIGEFQITAICHVTVPKGFLARFYICQTAIFVAQTKFAILRTIEYIHFGEIKRTQSVYFNLLQLFPFMDPLGLFAYNSSGSKSFFVHSLILSSFLRDRWKEILGYYNNLSSSYHHSSNH